MKKISKFQKNKKLINSLLIGIFALSAAPSSIASYNNSYMVEDTNGNKTEIVTSEGFRPKEDVKKDLDQFCFQLESGSTNLPSLQSYIKNIEKLSDFTKELYEQVKESKTYFCETGKVASKNAMAHFKDSINAIILQNINETEDIYLTHYLIHEMAHSAQKLNKSYQVGNHWDLESRIKSSFAKEAAANIVVIIAAFEGKQNGQPQLWNSLELLVRSRSNTSVFTIELLHKFKNSYKAGIEAGETHIDSINNAGEESWIEIISKSELWKKGYATNIINHYISIVNNKYLSADKVESRMPADKQMSNMGQIGEYNFSQNINLDSFIINGQDGSKKLPIDFLYKIEEIEETRKRTGPRSKELTN